MTTPASKKAVERYARRVEENCKKKLRFRSRAKARRKAKSLHGTKVYPYRCRWCGNWHLSRLPARQETKNQASKEKPPTGSSE